jgi:hypothetical protein
MPENTAPPASKRKQFIASGAGWQRVKAYDLGNTQIEWSFTSQIQLANFQAAAQLAATIGDVGQFQGVLEWWIQDAASVAYNVYRATDCAVTAEILTLENVGITLGYKATFGGLVFCGSETPYPDVLGDGLGNVLGDGNGNILGCSINGLITDPSTWTIESTGTGTIETTGD